MIRIIYWLYAQWKNKTADNGISGSWTFLFLFFWNFILVAQGNPFAIGEWIMEHTAWRRQIFAACATKSMKVNGIEIFRLRPIKNIFRLQWIYGRFLSSLLFTRLLNFGTLVQYMWAYRLANVHISISQFLSFFINFN